MGNRLDGQVTLVTGAASGTGKGIARQLGRCRIRVNAMAPGATIGSMTAYVANGDAGALDQAERLITRTVPLGRPVTPDDIANAAQFLAGGEVSRVNGALVVVDAAGEVVGDRNGRFVHMDTRLVSEAGQTS